MDMEVSSPHEVVVTPRRRPHLVHHLFPKNMKCETDVTELCLSLELKLEAGDPCHPVCLVNVDRGEVVTVPTSHQHDLRGLDSQCTHIIPSVKDGKVSEHYGAYSNIH